MKNKKETAIKNIIISVILGLIAGFGGGYFLRDAIKSHSDATNPQPKDQTYSASDSTGDDMQQPKLKLIETHWGKKNFMGIAQICGTVQNTGNVIDSNPYIEFNLYDKQGVAIGFSNDTMKVLVPKGKAKFCCVVSKKGVYSYKLNKLQ